MCQYPYLQNNIHTLSLRLTNLPGCMTLTQLSYFQVVNGDSVVITSGGANQNPEIIVRHYLKGR